MPVSLRNDDDDDDGREGSGRWPSWLLVQVGGEAEWPWRDRTWRGALPALRRGDGINAIFTGFLVGVHIC